MTIDELTQENLKTLPVDFEAGEAELDAITRALEGGEVKMDLLELAVSRADFLYRHLSQFMTNVENKVKPLAESAKDAPTS